MIESVLNLQFGHLYSTGKRFVCLFYFYSFILCGGGAVPRGAREQLPLSFSKKEKKKNKKRGESRKNEENINKINQNDLYVVYKWVKTDEFLKTPLTPIFLKFAPSSPPSPMKISWHRPCVGVWYLSQGVGCFAIMILLSRN